MTRPPINKFIKYISYTLVFLSFSQQSVASDFSLPFINGADLGNVYSGWAASANDASTAYANPAGLVRITQPQVVAAAVSVMGHTQFQGTSTTLVSSQTGVANGVAGGFGPLLYFAAPISKNVVIGFGANSPFGLGTNYRTDSIVRYAATRTKIVDVDLGPSIGVKINEKLSLGLGFDAQRLTATLNSMYGPPFSVPDAELQNHLTGWGYGWHGGVLYQFMPTTRAGISYNSQTMFHTTGDSEVFGNTGEIRTTNQKASIILPSRTQLSIYHELTPRWALMGTVFYDHWSSLNQVTLKNTMTPFGTLTSATIPLQYHDTFDYAIGTNFKATEKWMFKTGVQYFNTPSNNRDRSVPDPIGQMILVGLGAHFQQNCHLGYDIGYAHDFFQQTVINYVTPFNTVIGHSNTGSNVFSAQITVDA